MVLSQRMHTHTLALCLTCMGLELSEHTTRMHLAFTLICASGLIERASWVLFSVCGIQTDVSRLTDPSVASIVMAVCFHWQKPRGCLARIHKVQGMSRGGVPLSEEGMVGLHVLHHTTVS